MGFGIDFGKGDEVGARELLRELLIEGTYLFARLTPVLSLAKFC